MVRYVELDIDQEDCPYVNTSDVFRNEEMYVYQWELTKRSLKTRGIISSKDYKIDEYVVQLKREKNNLGFRFISGGKNCVLFSGEIRLTNAMKILSHYGYVIGPFTIKKGSEIWRVEFDNLKTKEDALSVLDKYNSFKILCDKKIITYDRGTSIWLDTILQKEAFSLSLAEKNAIVTAYRMGYFDTPKKNNSDDIARALGVSKTAFLKNLRNGEKKLLGILIKNAP